eukprot:TRINITY_DN15125_c0_g1_i1.p1 TRINITY_DN15125_c0_g1~~TRINITY_DN15125_c0_g1_i1.p1  ORF type:complete len:155 (+),score=10.54 TRINITY_DN15125_c0_g1_i1:22-465(+)
MASLGPDEGYGKRPVMAKINYALACGAFIWGYVRVHRSRNFIKGFLPVSVTGMLWCSSWAFDTPALYYEAYLAGIAGSSILFLSFAGTFVRTRRLRNEGVGCLVALVAAVANGVGAAQEWERVLLNGRSQRKYPNYVPRFASDIWHK